MFCIRCSLPLLPALTHPPLNPQLGTSAAIFYGYIFIISLILWGWVKYMKGDVKIVNMFCVYGERGGWLHFFQLGARPLCCAVLWLAPPGQCLFVILVTPASVFFVGYAMTIFVPISIICIIPVAWVKWTAVMIGTALSGGFLVMNMRRITQDIHLGK